MVSGGGLELDHAVCFLAKLNGIKSSILAASERLGNSVRTCSSHANGSTPQAAGQHQAVDDSAGSGSVNRIAEQPTLPSRSEDSDVTLQQIVVYRHSTVLDVPRQIFPLIEGIGDGIAEFGIWQNLRSYCVKPDLERVEDRNTVFVSEAANTVRLRLAIVVYFVPRLPLDPIELIEELQGLFRWPAGLFPCVERSKKAPPGMSHASDMRCIFRCAPSLIAVAHQDAQ